MIIAERKTIDELKQYIAGYKNILVTGCGACVTVCFAGGEKEVGILASQLRLLCKKEGKETVGIIEQTVKRQCEKEFTVELENNLKQADAVICLACGAGVQFIARYFPEKPVFSGVNTKFLGGTDEPGIWTENCQLCGDCLLDKTGGICPVSRCSKSLLNGPCGGSQNGKCEINKEIDCAWQLIYDRMKLLGRLNELEQIQPIKDWSKSRDGGPRKVVRDDLKL